MEKGKNSGERNSVKGVGVVSRGHIVYKSWLTHQLPCEVALWMYCNEWRY